ncbi:Rne/Rng family ribonuclease [Baekduia sp.]|uniref:Rne/Rng family ribonuclease n=1 Tax=Baekduia sp. TaxID=2600305 RepID=UPI002E0C85F2|nr:Rne/Rng family ribonuclease [Baekduia sp.]
MRKQVLVSVDRGETRVALMEATGAPAAASPRRNRSRGGNAAASGNASATKAAPRTKAANDGWRVAELYLERRGNRSIVGNIYKGKVDNVLPGLEAAFVDIGLDKNGFLHVDEIVIPGVEVARRGRAGSKGKSIGELLKPGQEVVVQVVKDPLKTKGARLSMDLTIAGRYMVYTPTGEGVGVSKRLDDKERDRLRREAKGLDLKGGGAIVRTAAHGATRQDFERELQYLFKLHEVLDKRVADTIAPEMVFQEADLSVRVVRDIFSADFEKAIVDDEQQFHRLVSFFSRTAPELVDRVELWQESKPLFESWDVEKVIDGLMSKRVDLPSGGYLLIEYAEALTVIDVNSGSFVGRGKQARLEDTITRTNLEAADEVVQQLRLRDIGGIIVIDFIDMARAKNREAVLKTLRKALDEDRTKTFTAEISKLGLVEMTRQNVTEGVREIMSRPCPTCHGEGVIKSEETIAIEFERQLREIAARAKRGTEAFLVQVNPRVSAKFTGEGARVLHALEAETGKIFHFEGSEGLPLDHFAITQEGASQDIEERAIPFKEGDEVLVNIIEPHMYEVDDAVAKIDGYIISVVNGGRFVGTKKLVRIEEAGRTAAVATLIDNGEEEGGEDGESLESKPRRRGRRGGRRRSAVKAEATSE